MDFPVIDPVATGACIRELRMERHITVAGLKDMLELESVQAIYKWQRGECLPSVDNLYAISRLLGVPVDNIIRGNREEDAGPPVCILWGVVINFYKFQIVHFWFQCQKS